MSKRDQILDRIRIATAQGDDKGAMRIYVENRVNYQAFLEAVANGRAQRGNQ